MNPLAKYNRVKTDIVLSSIRGNSRQKQRRSVKTLAKHDWSEKRNFATQLVAEA